MANNGTDPIRILVLSAQTDVTEQLQRIFSGEPHYRLQFVDAAEQAAHALTQSRVDIIVVDDVLSDSTPLEAIRYLASNFANVPIITLAEQLAVAYVRETLLAGARAFISKPIQESEAVNTLNQIAQMEFMRRQTSASNGNGANGTNGSNGTGRKHHVVTVMSPKGGSGVTMLSVNLAVILRNKTKGRVVLLESQSSMGDLEPAMSLQARFTIGDMLQQTRTPDHDLIDGALAEHSSGVRVLVSSRNLEDNGLMTADAFEHLVDHLTDMSDYIVIDTGTMGEEQTAAALAISDTVLLVTTPEITSLRRVALFLEAADRGGFPREKLHLVVNRDGVPGSINSGDISQHLNLQIAAKIPEDAALVTYAFNQGVPLSISDSRSAVARSIEKLVDNLLPKPKPQVRAKSSQGFMGRISTMLNFSPA
jgi:pilus assembly protein CpaE